MSTAVINELFNVTMNILMISIPEETVLISFCLILIGRFDLLKFKNIKLILIPVVPAAILSNVLRFYFKEVETFIPIIGALTMFVLILPAFKINVLKDRVKVFIGIILSFIIVGTIQFSYAPLFSYATNTNLNEASKFWVFNLIISSPERIIEICFVAYILVKRNSYLKINLVKTLIKSKSQALVVIIIIVLNLAFLCIMGKLVAYDRILSGYSFVMQLIFIATVVIFPVLNIVALWSAIYNITSRETFERMLTKERLKTLTSILEAYADSKKYDKIDLVISDINKHINSLYKEDV